jgi:hypothetical protein
MRARLLRFTAFLLLLTFVPAVANAQACLMRCLQHEHQAARVLMTARLASHSHHDASEARNRPEVDSPAAAHAPHGSSCLFALLPLVVDPAVPQCPTGYVETWTAVPPATPDSFISPPPEHRPRSA